MSAVTGDNFIVAHFEIVLEHHGSYIFRDDGDFGISADSKPPYANISSTIALSHPPNDGSLATAGSAAFPIASP